MIFRIRDTQITINTSDQQALLAAVKTRLRAGQGFALATLNLDHLVKMRTDAQFRADYAAHDLIVADGNPIVWLSRLAGHPVSLVPGADQVVPLAKIAAETGTPVALIGSTDAALAKAADQLKSLVPDLTIALQYAPPFGFEPKGKTGQDTLDQIKSSGARLCFLALGAPRQEGFAAFARTQLPQVGFASIGAGLDFHAGTQNRAPEWVRKLALEWLWRAISSPMRLGPRYLKCIAILPGLTLNALKQRLF